MDRLGNVTDLALFIYKSLFHELCRTKLGSLVYMSCAGQSVAEELAMESEES